VAFVRKYFTAAVASSWKGSRYADAGLRHSGPSFFGELTVGRAKVVR
jgi:hypothetical protein